MTMKFGCCCKKGNIETLAETGYDYVELSACELSGMDEPEFQDTLLGLKRSRIPCLAVNDFADSSPAVVGEAFDEEEIRAYATIVCARAAAAGARYIGIGAPNARIMPVKYSYYRAFEQAVTFIQIVAAEAARYGNLNIAVEALNCRSCNFCNTQQQALDLVISTGMPNVKLETDFYHMEMMAEPFELFGKLQPYIGHLHISEKNADDDRCFFEYDNTGILEKASTVLAEYGYTGNISVEVPLRSFSVEAAERALFLMKQYLS